MTIIQKMNSFIKKKSFFLSLVNSKFLKIQKFNPLFIITFLIVFSVLFFISSNFINKKNEENRSNFEEIIKTNQFSNLTNFFISKINSPYQEINYVIKNNDTIEKIFKKFKVRNQDNIFFKDMLDMEFGVWIAHGEGKFINTSTLCSKQKILTYYSDNYRDVMKYPQNPNGSEQGLAGVCSVNGRHLAMMPHPERCFKKWQLPYLDNYQDIITSPWVKMFDNIYRWCDDTKVN